MRRKEAEPHTHLTPPGPREIAAARRRAQLKCGSRLTETREAVFLILAGHGGPMTAYEVLGALSEQTERPRNPPTVYRALEFLLAEGLIARLESRNAFTLCAHAGEAHACVFFLCRCCGEAREVMDPAIEGRLKAAAAGIGFTPDHPVVEVEGRCAACRDGHAGEAAP